MPELKFDPERFDELIEWALTNGIEVRFYSDFDLKGPREPLTYSARFVSRVHTLDRHYELRSGNIPMLLADVQCQLQSLFVKMKMFAPRRAGGVPK